MLSKPFVEAITLNTNKMSGKLVVQEWLNGTKQMEPITLPKLVIKNASGTVVTQTTMKREQAYVYSYEIDVSALAKGIYTIEVQGTNPNNTSNHQNITIAYQNKTIGNIGNDVLKIQTGKLVKEEKNNKYDGYMLSKPFVETISLKGTKISGKLVVQEWLNGTKQMEPITLPKLVIKNASGTAVAQTTMRREQAYVYVYDLDIASLGEGSYTLEVQGTNPNNTSNHQKITITYQNKEIGKINTDSIKIENGKLTRKKKNDKYDGYMLSKPYDETITLKGTKILGRLIVQEWLNGTKQMEPITLPKLVIKNESGTIVTQATMKKEIPYLYSYEIDVATLTAGNYTLEVQGTNPNNTSTHQKIAIQYKNKQIGTVGQNALTINAGKIVVANKTK